MTVRRIITAWRRFSNDIRDDGRGMALVEFAIVVPVLLTLYLGGYQIGDAIACNRKVTIATRAMVDLTTQNLSGATSAAEVDSNIAAVKQVLAPYNASIASITVTEVTTDTNGNTTVQWSRASGNATAYARGSAFTIPSVYKSYGNYYIVAQVTYPYTPSANFGFVNTMNLGDSIMMLPRNSNKIDCNDC